MDLDFNNIDDEYYDDYTDTYGIEDEIDYELSVERGKSPDDILLSSYTDEEGTLNLIGVCRDVTILERFTHHMSKKDASKFISSILNEVNLLDKDYKWSTPRKVQIPKPGGFRDIFIFSDIDRVYQKVINWALSRKFDNLLSPNLFSYRKGIDRNKAVRNVISDIQHNECLKVDISNYFLSVEKKMIYQKVEELYITNDSKILLKNHFNISAYSTADEKTVEKMNLGLIPGSAVSAFFSNFLIRVLDFQMYNFTINYARYCDDILLVNKSHDTLLDNLDYIKNFLSVFNLEVKESKTKYYKNGELITFLGFNIQGSKIDISDESFKKQKGIIKHITKKYRKLADKKIISRDKALELSINAINKKYIRDNPYKEKYTILPILCQSINTLETIRELDFYIINMLRYVYTGNHNKSNTRITNSFLRRYGYVPISELYLDFKNERGVYMYKSQLL